MSYADDLQAVSVDEALIEVTSNVAKISDSLPSDPADADPATAFAELLRTKVKNATGCEGTDPLTMHLWQIRIDAYQQLASASRTT